MRVRIGRRAAESIARSGAITAAHRMSCSVPSSARECAGLNDAQHLHPHGDHGQEQADRGLRQRFFSNRANHDVSPLRLERTGNIVHLLFWSQDGDYNLDKADHNG